MTIDKNQLIYILIIIIYAIIIVGSIYAINYHNNNNNNNAIIGTWTSENMFKEDSEQIQLICFKNQTGYIIKNNITMPINWECNLLQARYICTSENGDNFPIVFEGRWINDYFYLYCFEYKTKLYQQTT